MAEDTVYALDSGGNRIATFSAEQILEAINAAITTGEIPSELTAFIDAIKEQNKGESLKFWLGTQAEFLALENTEENIIYFINDSTNLKELSDALDQLKDQLQSGDFVVKKAEEADDATNATDADNVKTKINGKAISSIFESDGITVKKATQAIQYSDGAHLLSYSSNNYTSWEHCDVSDIDEIFRRGGIIALRVDVTVKELSNYPVSLQGVAIVFAGKDNNDIVLSGTASETQGYDSPVIITVASNGVFVLTKYSSTGWTAYRGDTGDISGTLYYKYL